MSAETKEPVNWYLLIWFWYVTYAYCWHYATGVTVLFLVSASWHNCCHQLKEETVNWKLLIQFWYMTYVHTWHDFAIIAGTTASVWWHHYWHQLHSVVARIIWYKRGCQLITIYLILMCDIFKQIAWSCYHCWHYSIGITALTVYTSQHKSSVCWNKRAC